MAATVRSYRLFEAWSMAMGWANLGDFMRCGDLPQLTSQLSEASCMAAGPAHRLANSWGL